jgi:formylmethanofuran dehydrogenase subunit E-like metal-binding protein
MIEWRDDMENVPRGNSEVFLAWYPLDDLSDIWCRCMTVYVDNAGEYIFAGRSCAGFSPNYMPTHWSYINEPNSNEPSNRVGLA